METEKKPSSQPNPEPEKNWTEELDIERSRAANQDVGRARGRAPGNLNKVENAPTSVQEKDVDAGDKVEEIKEKRGLEQEAEIRRGEADQSFEEKAGEKKIEQILEEGKSEEGKSWADKVRPDEKMEFESLDQDGNQAKAINLLREDSAGYFMPEGRNGNEVILDQAERKQAVELIEDNREKAPDELLKEREEAEPKNEYKAGAFKATRMNEAELEEIKEESFSDEIQRDEAADAARTEFMSSEEEMDMDADMDFD